MPAFFNKPTCFAGGCLVEIWQAIMPLNRTGDVYDALGDMAGTVVGVVVAWGVRKVING